MPMGRATDEAVVEPEEEGALVFDRDLAGGGGGLGGCRRGSHGAGVQEGRRAGMTWKRGV